MEKQKDWVIKELHEVFQPKAIYLRNDVYIRELEGLEQEKEFWYDESDIEVWIEKNGVVSSGLSSAHRSPSNSTRDDSTGKERPPLSLSMNFSQKVLSTEHPLFA